MGHTWDMDRYFPYTSGSKVHTRTRDDNGGRKTDDATVPPIKKGASIGIGGGGGILRDVEVVVSEWDRGDSSDVGRPMVGG